MAMEPPLRPSSSLFDVYLRLRPSTSATAERFLDVEEPGPTEHPTHITIKPPSHDHRKRAIEKFAFTRVFEEDAVQLELFKGTGVGQMIEGVLGVNGKDGRDGLLATLGVTGSGKSHTILGTKSQRGLTQMALDVLFQSIGPKLVQSFYGAPEFSSLAAADVSEAHMFTATAYLDSLYGDNQSERFPSRAQTPMPDCSSFLTTTSRAAKNMPRPSTMPQLPPVEDLVIPTDQNAEYALVVSMYEVYNDRIFDLLARDPGAKIKNPHQKRRALLFKSTEQSPDRKVVAGLTKIICGCLEEALMVLETGLLERKVAGTGSNAVSSRSHGFFCIEVKKRNPHRMTPWSSSTLTIVDLAGSERARHAKTVGATLAEAGKINESLMYLGQCMQMQSDNQDGAKNLVPFRQCKLTELLFSNSFAPQTAPNRHHHTHSPQKSIMIVTADPKGDFNATSQILRYSALAREVTVPRIPSTTSTHILPSTPGPYSHHKTGSVSSSQGRTSPSWSPDLEAANNEISRLSSEIEILALRLCEETSRRKAAEQSWSRAEQQLISLETEIREECFLEMEKAVQEERRRWQAAWDREADQHEEFMDRKVDLVIRAVKAEEKSRKKEPEVVRVYEDPDPGLVEKLEMLERENEELRRRVERGEREALGRTPVKGSAGGKKMRVLKAKRWEDPEGGLGLGDSDE